MKRLLVGTFWTVVVLATLLVGSVFAMMIAGTMTPPNRESAKDILALPASALTSNGKLSDAFGFASSMTRAQVEALEKEVAGELIDWTLPVYDVQTSERRILVQTGSAPGHVDIDCAVSNPTANDIAQALKLQPGDLVRCKGRIKGARLVTGLEISPAAIVW